MYFLNNKASQEHFSEEDHKVLKAASVQSVFDINNINGPYLFMQEEVVFMADSRLPSVKPISVDFETSKLKTRLTKNLMQRELLYKAIKSKPLPTQAIDGTAGMGLDSMILSGLGLKVTSYEDNPFIYLMLKNGLQRACKSEFELIASMAKRIELKFLSFQKAIVPSDLLYLDFMFDMKDKKSKSKKNMEFFKQIVDPTSLYKQNELIEESISLKHKKIVIKRPKKAQLYAHPAYSHTIEGKAIRFDIYLPNK